MKSLYVLATMWQRNSGERDSNSHERLVVGIFLDFSEPGPPSQQRLSIDSFAIYDEILLGNANQDTQKWHSVKLPAIS